MTSEHHLCLDCGSDTLESGDYYMLWGDVWHQIHPDALGMLCLACAQSRLGRKLTLRDLSTAAINFRPELRARWQEMGL